MRYADVRNIWALDMQELSRADQGRIYFERAKQVLHPAGVKGGKVPTSRGRVARFWLRSRIGCSAGTISQNPGIRALLATCDAAVVTLGAAPGYRRHVAPDLRTRKWRSAESETRLTGRRLSTLSSKEGEG